MHFNAPEQQWNFLRLTLAWNTSAVDDGARDKENSNKAIRLDSYNHRHLSLFSKIADFDRLENKEQTKQTPTENQSTDSCGN